MWYNSSMNQDRYDQEEFNEFIEEMYEVYKLQKKLRDGLNKGDFQFIPIEDITPPDREPRPVLNPHKYKKPPIKPITDEDIYTLGKNLNISAQGLNKVFKHPKHPSS